MIESEEKRKKGNKVSALVVAGVYTEVGSEQRHLVGFLMTSCGNKSIWHRQPARIKEAALGPEPIRRRPPPSCHVRQSAARPPRASSMSPFPGDFRAFSRCFENASGG